MNKFGPKLISNEEPQIPNNRIKVAVSLRTPPIPNSRNINIYRLTNPDYQSSSEMIKK
jgi:hypothetical protein